MLIAAILRIIIIKERRNRNMQGIFALILLLPMLGNSGIFLPFFCHLLNVPGILWIKTSAHLTLIIYTSVFSLELTKLRYRVICLNFLPLCLNRIMWLFTTTIDCSLLYKITLSGTSLNKDLDLDLNYAKKYWRLTQGLY